MLLDDILKPFVSLLTVPKN